MPENSTTFPVGSAHSAQPSARTIGAVWLLYFVISSLGAVFTKGLIVPTDAALTATSILAHAGRYRAGFAFDLIGNAIYLALTALLYGLFRPVNRNLALIAVFFSLTGCIVQIFGELLRLVPVVLLTESHVAGAFTVAQMQAASVLSLAVYNHVYDISFILFALFELALGYLIVKSRYVPRVFGWIWMASGGGWLTFLWPPLARTIWPVLFGLGGLAELGLVAWLLVKGVNTQAREAPAQ
ncbi:MAG: DUF4386 domain-containing protein [Gemmatimonadaceae bacterium]